MLYSPAGLRGVDNPVPLVLVIHGGASTDRGMLKLTKRRWNALAYFERVIDDVAARRNIDQTRVFATGTSRRGQASYYLACNLPDRIRAIMPVAMGMPEFMRDECTTGGSPVGFALMNGTADPQVPYERGQVTVFRQKRDFVVSAEETIDLWRERNGCLDAPKATMSIDKPGDQTSVEVKEWSSCTGAPVKFFRVNNGGHAWPSGVQYLSPRIVGETSQDIDAADEAWSFLLDSSACKRG